MVRSQLAWMEDYMVHPPNVIPKPIDPVENGLHATFWLARRWTDHLLWPKIVTSLVAATTVIDWTWIRTPYIELIGMFSKKGIGEEATPTLA